MVSKGFEKGGIFITEDAALFVEKLNDTQSLSIPSKERYTEKAACPVSGLGIDLFIEAGVGIDILDIQDYPFLEAVPRDSNSGRNPNHLLFHPEGYR